MPGSPGVTAGGTSGGDIAMDSEEVTGRVVGVFVGRPRSVGGPDPQSVWTTGLFKAPVTGRIRVTRAGLEGDGQADLVHHGGPDKAVLAYAASHYARWRAEMDLFDMEPGGLGENLAVEGGDEGSVCIGDTWEVGGVLMQVTQARTPCWKLERRWGCDGLVRRILETARTGWYLRVLREGVIEEGMEMRLVARPHPEWTVARALRVRVTRSAHPEEAASLAALPELSAAWRR